MIAGCAGPSPEVAADGTVAEAPKDDALAASLQTEPRGDTVFLSLQVTNPGDAPLQLTYPTGQSYDFVIAEDGREIWRWSEDRMFTQAIRLEHIAGGETATFEAQWVPPPGLAGEYVVRGFLTAEEHRVEQQSRIRLR